MDQFINQNLEDREQTRAALTHKLEALELRLRDSIGKVKTTVRRSTDVPYQVRQRPWTMFGISMLLGCAVGRLTGGKHADIQRSDTAAKLTNRWSRESILWIKWSERLEPLTMQTN